MKTQQMHVVSVNNTDRDSEGGGCLLELQKDRIPVRPDTVWIEYQ
jgi:hypothetical protein